MRNGLATVPECIATVAWSVLPGIRIRTKYATIGKACSTMRLLVSCYQRPKAGPGMRSGLRADKWTLG